MKNKNAQLSMEYIIAGILVILVIFSVAMFIFKPDLLNWIRLLPGYEVPDEDDIKEVTPDEETGDGVICVEFGFVGELEPTWWPFKEQFIYSSDGIRTDFIVRDDGIRWYRPFIMSNKKVANFVGLKINVFDRFLTDGTFTGVNLEILEKLEGGQIIVSTNRLCK